MPLQKSFSEQNDSENAQQRGQWQRHKTYNGPRFGGQNDENRKPEGPQTGLRTEASSATKRKLKNFEFAAESKDGKASRSRDGSKSVPIDLEDDEKVEVVDTPVTKIASRPQQLSHDEPAKKGKGPGTPCGGRLALPDLLSMADVDSPSRILAKTPDDRVSWNHDPAAYSSSNFDYAETRGTKRQRAKSSSPMSSPARSTHFGVETPGLPVGQLNMNTPKLGPGLDLWSNYGISGAPSASGVANPLMAQLMSGTPSPRDGSARKLAALSRSFSCGDQVAKKRRTGTEKTGYDLFADIQKGSVTKHPRVGALLDTIKEKGTRGSKSTASGPSSSSPAGIRHQDDIGDVHLESSPLAPRTMGPPKAVSAPGALNKMLPPLVATPPKAVKAVAPKSSPETDYGDDDYDDAMFHEASLQVYGTQAKQIRQPSSSPSKWKAPVLGILKPQPIPHVQQAALLQPLQPRYVAPANRQQGQTQPHIKTPLQQVQSISKPASKPVSRQATLPAPKQMTPPPPKPAAKPAFVWKEEEDEFAGVFSDIDDAEIIPDADAIENKYNAQAAAANSAVTAKPTTPAVMQRAPLAEKPIVRTENQPPQPRYVAPKNRPGYVAPVKPQIVPAQPAYKPPVKTPVIKEPDEDYDKFFDDDDEDFGAAAKQVEETQKQQAQQQVRGTGTSISSYPPPSGSQKPRVIQRYLVTSISEQRCTNERGRTENEKVLQVQPDKSPETYTIYLRGSWIETPVTEKAFVHIIGDFVNNSITVDDMHNLIILHPDHLLSSTVVADSFSCTRRAVLQDRVKATSDISAPLVYGTILHEIFQESLMANRWNTPWLWELIDKTCKAHLEQLYCIKVQIPQAVEHLRSKMNELQAWASVFVSSTPNPAATVDAGGGEKANMAITKLLDVEEHVWSPMYGLKGNIDATVQVTMQDPKTRKERVLTVPFEVKTGKSVNASHRAQTALYTLLLSDRYDIEIVYGILYYMENSEIVRIPRIRHELRHMIMQRNALSVYIRDKSTTLPPMLKKEPLCQRCYAKTTCFIYHKLAEDGDGVTSGMAGKFDEVVKHLTPRHKEFFLKWDDLLTKEERESMKFRRELWTLLSKEREKLGRCFSNVVIEPGSAYEEVDAVAAGGKINRFQYTLIRSEDGEGGKNSFLESQIVVGEPIVISDEEGHFALANGYVTHIRKHRITVTVDRRLHNARIRKPGFEEENNQVFASIMDVNKPGHTQASTQPKALVRYRLDKDEFSNGMATVRNNLIQVMTDSVFGAQKIRSLIVDLVAPKFRAKGTQYEIKDRASLNIDQRRAIEKVMSAEDYALVLGMPGTGKTTTIAHIIRALVSQGKSVLLTSYTHSAVDNILLKMKDDAIPILRLGAPAKIHAEVQTFARLASKPQVTFEDIRALWHDSPIVATTCLGTNHALFSERTFDYCIVDEASQITLPVCLGPIRLAKTFVLVGDHNQLPPLVANEDARKGGLDISLFKFLSDAAPEAVCILSHQYRMCQDVMELSNNLIYSGRLKCGTKAVAARTLHIPNPAGLMQCHINPQIPGAAGRKMCIGPHKGCWLADLLDPANKACFLNTDTQLPASRESAAGNRIVNALEAKVVTQLVSALLAIGVPGDEIGVMTHYRSQLALLKHGMRGVNSDVEMHTCDRFQGRDKEVVIISLVRSNENASIGELLKDWRRINVAFTRAKSKLIVVGSGSTLKGLGGGENEEMVGRFVRLMEEKRWVYDLPIGALEMHSWDESVGTQLSSLTAQSPEVGRWKKVDRKENVPPEWSKAGGGVTLKEGMKARREPKRQGANVRVMLDGRPVLRDIVNDTIG